MIKEPKLLAAQDILRKPGFHVVRLTYFGEIDGEPVLSQENDYYKFFRFQELKVMPKTQIDFYFKELFNNRSIFEKI